MPVDGRERRAPPWRRRSTCCHLPSHARHDRRGRTRLDWARKKPKPNSQVLALRLDCLPNERVAANQKRNPHRASRNASQPERSQRVVRVSRSLGRNFSLAHLISSPSQWLIPPLLLVGCKVRRRMRHSSNLLPRPLLCSWQARTQKAPNPAGSGLRISRV